MKRGISRSSQTVAKQKVESRRHVKNNNESVEEESPRQALKMKNVEDESWRNV